MQQLAMKHRRPRTEDFTTGWICPLVLEYAATKSALDELYDEPEHATVAPTTMTSSSSVCSLAKWARMQPPPLQSECVSLFHR
ncbi:hypothetical protein BDW68DRAFT_100758 [Aspergillus falconensis]